MTDIGHIDSTIEVSWEKKRRIINPILVLCTKCKAKKAGTYLLLKDHARDIKNKRKRFKTGTRAEYFLNGSC